MCSAPFSVDHDLFQWFKQRADETAATQWGCVDESLREAVNLINRLPEIAPVFCCEGHGVVVEETGEESDDQYRFYLLLVTWGSGTYLVEEIMRRVNATLPPERTLDIIVTQMLNFSPIESSGEFYTGICLERYNTPDDKPEFLKLLTEAIRGIVDEAV